jgi:hypothetical protein
MNTDQVKGVLTALLDMVRRGEIALPGVTVLKTVETDIQYILNHPLVLEIVAVAFSSASTLVTFLLGRFGIPLALVESILARITQRGGSQ